MNDLPGLPPVSADKGVSAPVPDPIESLESEEGGERSFDDALEDSGDLNESQAPETRRAIRGSLDRLTGRQGAHAQPGQAASKETPGPEGQAKAGGAHRSPSSNAGHRGSVQKPESYNAGHGGPVEKRVSSSAGHHGPAEKPVVSSAEHGEPVEKPEAGFARARVPETASGRTGSGSPARAAAASHPSAGAADPTPAASAAALMPAGDAGPASRKFPVDSTRRGASNDSPPEHTPPDVRPQAGSRREAQRLAGPPGARPPADQPRQASLGEGRVQSGLAGEAPARESSGTKAREPDETGHPDVQPADMTGLATLSSVPEPESLATPETAPVSASRTAEIAGQVADRILVAAPEPGSTGEVRISLKESVLDGSDVRIFREAGELRVVFQTRTEAAGQFLADNTTVLQQALGDRLRDERVRVEVELPAEAGGGADQQDNEGRSRQRYVAPEDRPGAD